MGGVTVRFMVVYEDSDDMTGHETPQPDLARSANLQDRQCSGLESLRSVRNSARAGTPSTEVKRRFGSGRVEVCTSEWSRACTRRDQYGLYGVFDRRPKRPDLIQAQEPLGRLLRFSPAGGRVIVDCHPMRSRERGTRFLTRRASGVLGRSPLIRRRKGEARGINC